MARHFSELGSVGDDDDADNKAVVVVAAALFLTD